MFDNKRILIVGFGQSGKSIFNLLKDKSCELVIFDDKIKKTHRHLIGYFDLAVVSPGIKDTSPVWQFIKQNNIPFITEIELGLIFCKAKHIIGITGTNGKTTTVTLLESILNTSGRKAIACGNNGVCFTSVCRDFEEDDYCILELSSFMLQHIKNSHLDFACFLNFKDDHLDFHKSINKYFRCKQRIFNFQNENDISILNADDKRIAKIKAKGNTFYFSNRKKVKGVYVRGQYFYFYDGQQEIRLFNKNMVRLLGNFNLENVCVAILLARLIGVSIEDIEVAVENFEPVKHRLNLIYEGDFKVFNDSKATNVASTVASLSCFSKNVILILGGSDKSENFDDIFKHKDKLKMVIMTGAIRKVVELYAIKNSFDRYKVIAKFRRAVHAALSKADKGDIVLFAPACASFDNFKNFEHRGEKFEKIVRMFFESK